jgi:uncharacterized phage-associated protein
MENKVQQVAFFFLEKAKNDWIKINHKKLQKLCYYAQAWSLAVNEKKLYNESIEAWVNWPVIPSIWHEYKVYWYSDIWSVDGDFDKETFTKKELAVLNWVYKIYWKCDSDYLVWLTHQEEPWLEARGELLGSDVSNKKISPKTMQSFYSKQLIKK